LTWHFDVICAAPEVPSALIQSLLVSSSYTRPTDVDRCVADLLQQQVNF